MTKKITKAEKEHIENKMLIIFSISMVAFIAMLFVYRGFLSGAQVLKMKPVLYTVSGVFLLGAVLLFLAGKLFKKDVPNKNLIITTYYKYSVVVLLFAVFSAFIAKFNVHGIKVIASLLGIYLLGAVIYYSFYFDFSKKPRLKFVVFGIGIVVIGIAVAVLASKLSVTLAALINVLMYKTPISVGASKVIMYVISGVIDVVGIASIIYGIKKFKA